jgi:hypothetical protein
VSTSRRASRMRAIALVVLFVGLAGAFLVGALVPAKVTSTTVGLFPVKSTSFVETSESGESAFNWLLALLVAGPAVVSASVLYGAAEISGAVRRGRGGSSRSERNSNENGEDL